MTKNDKERMQELINQAQELLRRCVTSSDTDFKKWQLRTETFLKEQFGEDSNEFKRFDKRTFFPFMISLSTSKEERYASYIKSCADGLRNTIAEFEVYLESEEEKDEMNNQNLETGKIEHSFSLDKVFVVHGHDGELKSEVARMLERQNIQAIILSEQVNQGKTIIEKIESYSDVGAAIILLTCDDFGKAKNDSDYKPRARQNVIFEAGYFMGKLSRNRTIIIYEEGIEIPSDLLGMVYTDKGNWKIDLCKELQAMGFLIDMNKL